MRKDPVQFQVEGSMKKDNLQPKIFIRTSFRRDRVANK